MIRITYTVPLNCADWQRKRSPHNRRLLYRVDVASNGREAVNLLEENDYALVLMDCMMPVLDGYEATGVIRDQASSVRNHTIPEVL